MLSVLLSCDVAAPCLPPLSPTPLSLAATTSTFLSGSTVVPWHILAWHVTLAPVLLPGCLTQQPEHLAANAPASSCLGTTTCFLLSWHYYPMHQPWCYCPLSGHPHPTVALAPPPMLVIPLFDWHLYSFLANRALLLAASSHPTPACSWL